ncbi:hypothetical protein GWI33_014811 [Rhynchophorus ferrugineus]|uniref:Uncharacterized protein n=2 Tax=Rhynchophorus ferrugineus TaxID=354439 RepID=A0A834MBZ7_RHYFE|nr:hypothetical protein GWI33_014811 [Rhynchophorus ferrugineus]
MKILVAFSAILLVVLAQEHAHHGHHVDLHGLGPVHIGCQGIGDSKIDEEVFQKLDQNEPVDLPPNFGKHMLCMMQGIGAVTSDGHISQDGVKTHIRHVVSDESKVSHILKDCAVAKDTPEQTSIDLDACLRKHKVFGGHGGHHHH